MTALAALRPDSWGFPLLLHVLGAMLLVGSLVAGLAFLGFVSARAAFRALLFGAVPGWILMRIGGQWIYSKEGWSGEDDPTWLGIGFFTADLGGVLLLVTVILAGLSSRRTGISILGRFATGLATVLLVAYLVTVWAMTAKPS